MRHYYIKMGRAANWYGLIYTEDAAEEAAARAAGYERITRSEAIDYCRAERDRRAYDPAFGGYADVYIYPWTEQDALHGLNCIEGAGYIAERRSDRVSGILQRPQPRRITID